jgi:O-antigen/teichoic acid export membrane protein
MSGPGSLRRNFAWTLAGSVVFAGSQWATLVLVTKVASTRAAGDWTLGLALTGPIFIFSQFKLRVVQVTDVKNEHSWGDYLALRLLSSVAAFLTSAGIVALGYRSSVAVVILMIALSKVFDGASDLIYGQEQKREQMRPIARSQIARGTTAVAASVLALLWTRSPAWCAAATAASYGVWLIWDWTRLLAILGDEAPYPRWGVATLWPLFRRVLPLGFVTAIGSLQINIPRYFLEAYASREELGVFGTISALLMLGNIVVAALANVALPGMATFVAGGQWRLFRRRVGQLLLMGCALGAAAVLVSKAGGRPILALVYSSEVAQHDDVLFWLAVNSGLIWSYVFLGTALDAMRRFHVQPWIHTTSSGVIAVMSLLLVPRYRMHGACWAMLIGYGAESLMYLLAVALPLRNQKEASS